METILLKLVWPIGSRPYLTRLLFYIFDDATATMVSLISYFPCFHIVSLTFCLHIVLDSFNVLATSDGVMISFGS